MTWNEHDHPRRADGEFTRAAVGSWVEKISKEWGKHFDRDTPLQESRDYDGHPAGHEAARNRLEHLWSIPDRGRGIERTDAEQDELEGLEDAFSAYRDELGLTEARDDGFMIFKDRNGARYSQYGEFLHDGPITDERPPSGAWGYERVGDHPGHKGRVGGAKSPRGRSSIHPEAGGLWINRKNPGSKHRPRYLDDFGTPVTGLQPKTHPSEARKDNMIERRRGDLRGRPENESDPKLTRRTPGRARREFYGETFGYGMRTDTNDREEATVFTARMKRIQPRVRQETARQPVRRTPRGTKIENWMSA